MSGLWDYATDTQKKHLTAIKEHGGQAKAAKALGINRTSIFRSMKTLRKNAALRGYSPENDMTQTTADGYLVKGTSTLYDEAGNVKIQWVKTEQDKQKIADDLKELIEGICEGIKGKAKPIKLPKGKFDTDLMSIIILGDAHLGMYAWGEETLNMDFDTDIACKDIREAIDNLVERSPNAETGVLVDVGDFMHMNTANAVTARGTPVDVDTRYPRVLRAAGMIMRYCIDRMLKKYKKVKVIVAKGNHNPEPAVAVALMLQFYYDKEKRVEVMDTIGHHHYLQFGSWLIGVNHGDKIKPAKLVSMMARDHKFWSEAKFRIWLTGHIHHEKVIEIDGCTVTSYSTLAPSDAWHASMGYRARQAATLITIHKTKGKHSTIEYDLL